MTGRLRGVLCVLAGTTALTVGVLPNMASPVTGAGVEVVNAGRGGNNTRNLLDRVEGDVLRHRPDVVVLMAGTNDALNSGNSVPPGDYAKNLTRLVRTIQASGSRVVLMTIPPCHERYLLQRHDAAFYGAEGPSGRVARVNRIVTETAGRLGTALVDVHGLLKPSVAEGNEKASLLRTPANSGTADGVHPTAEGYRKIAEAVAEVIKAEKLPHCRVVCFGDSITLGAGVAGAGTARGDTYPAQLKRLLDQSE